VPFHPVTPRHPATLPSAGADEAEYLDKLRTAVASVVARKRETGIHLVNDVEYGHSMGTNV
jgi:hypothetical protein